MTTMIQPNTNGRKRPNLGEQINRLDSMLEGLSEGLNEAVADAVKAAVGDAVQQAVQSVLTEVLTNPEILAKLRPQPASTAPPQPAAPTFRQRLNNVVARIRTRLTGLRTACAEKIAAVKTLISHQWRCAIGRLASLWTPVRMLRPFRFQILVALAIGVMIAVGVWHDGRWLGAVASGINGFVLALSVQIGLWLRQMFAGAGEKMA